MLIALNDEIVEMLDQGVMQPDEPFGRDMRIKIEFARALGNAPDGALDVPIGAEVLVLDCNDAVFTYWRRPAVLCDIIECEGVIVMRIGT